MDIYLKLNTIKFFSEEVSIQGVHFKTVQEFCQILLTIGMTDGILGNLRTIICMAVGGGGGIASYLTPTKPKSFS